MITGRIRGALSWRGCASDLCRSQGSQSKSPRLAEIVPAGSHTSCPRVNTPASSSSRVVNRHVVQHASNPTLALHGPPTIQVTGQHGDSVTGVPHAMASGCDSAPLSQWTSASPQSIELQNRNMPCKLMTRPSVQRQATRACSDTQCRVMLTQVGSARSLTVRARVPGCGTTRSMSPRTASLRTILRARARATCGTR